MDITCLQNIGLKNGLVNPRFISDTTETVNQQSHHSTVQKAPVIMSCPKGSYPPQTIHGPSGSALRKQSNSTRNFWYKTLSHYNCPLKTIYEEHSEYDIEARKFKGAFTHETCGAACTHNASSSGYVKL